MRCCDKATLPETGYTPDRTRRRTIPAHRCFPDPYTYADAIFMLGGANRA
jgi:hypothetical protein